VKTTVDKAESLKKAAGKMSFGGIAEKTDQGIFG
jgi:hypothetical protein